MHWIFIFCFQFIYFILFFSYIFLLFSFSFSFFIFLLHLSWFFLVSYSISLEHFFLFYLFLDCVFFLFVWFSRWRSIIIIYWHTWTCVLILENCHGLSTRRQWHVEKNVEFLWSIQHQDNIQKKFHLLESSSEKNMSKNSMYLISYICGREYIDKTIHLQMIHLEEYWKVVIWQKVIKSRMAGHV